MGVAAGATNDLHRSNPLPVNSLARRIAVFYCGSVLLLVMILPWTTYGATE